MPEREQFLARALESIRTGSELSPEEVAALAHMSREELARFRPIWDSLGEQDRLGLLTLLNKWEQQTPRLEFNSVYRIGLRAPEPAVRAEAINSVVEDTSHDLLVGHADLAMNDEDPLVRHAAARGLAPFALRAELGELPAGDAELVERTLFAILDREDEAPRVRAAALASLGYLDTLKVSEEIRAGYQSPELQISAVRAMGRSANPSWLETLGLEATSDDASMRVEVARAFGEMADESAVGLLLDLLDDSVLDVRLAAIAALGQIGGEEAREALIYALEDKREVVRIAAEVALSDLEERENPLG